MAINTAAAKFSGKKFKATKSSLDMALEWLSENSSKEEYLLKAMILFRNDAYRFHKLEISCKKILEEYNSPAWNKAKLGCYGFAHQLDLEKQIIRVEKELVEARALKCRSYDKYKKLRENIKTLKTYPTVSIGIDKITGAKQVLIDGSPLYKNLDKNAHRVLLELVETRGELKKVSALYGKLNLNPIQVKNAVGEINRDVRNITLHKNHQLVESKGGKLTLHADLMCS